MRLTIAIKDENGKLYNLPDRYEFAPEELNQLVEDFTGYCTQEANGATKRGGVYKCMVSGDEKMLFLKFDEIIYMG